ncbi:hypothetical protein HY642_06150 [Candidatus Woesearchaeota archaeon]|nr:hypothetical protein [Candidatus Woesearchaeota archaeon]
MLSHDQMLDTWKLFTASHGQQYPGREAAAENVHRYARDAPALINAEESCAVSTTAYVLSEAHSMRSAWLPMPFEFEGKWYPGFEYKGFGAEGRKITRSRNMYWGGVIPSYGLQEFENSRFAYELCHNSQLPLKYYEAPISDADRVAVIVRSCQCPIRISHFLSDRKLYADFLRVKGMEPSEYASYLGSALGHTFKAFFDHGYCKGNVDSDNFTADGEAVDMELANRCVRAENFAAIPLKNLHSSLQGTLDVMYTALQDKALALVAAGEFAKALLGHSVTLKRDVTLAVLRELLNKRVEPLECCYETPAEIKAKNEAAAGILRSIRDRFVREKISDGMNEVELMLNTCTSRTDDVFLTAEEYLRFRKLDMPDVIVEQTGDGAWLRLYPWQLQALRVQDLFPTFTEVR